MDYISNMGGEEMIGEGFIKKNIPQNTTFEGGNMEENIGEILATKRDWRKAERRRGDRRQKDGSPEDRKLSADILRINRATDKNIEQINKDQEHSAWIVAICMLIAGLVLIAFSGRAHAYTNEEAIKTIVGEASNQGFKGMVAVGEVIRTKGSLKGFYGLHASHSAHEPKWVWKQARKAWLASKTTHITHYAEHFENIHTFGKPYWVKNCVKTFEYKDHIFYKET